MAITYVGGNTGSLDGTTTDLYTVSLTALTGGSGSTALEGDIVVVALASGSAADITANMAITGYTIVQTAYSNGTRDVSTLVGYKIMGATPDTEVSLNGYVASNSARPSVCTVQVWRGVDTTTPMDVTTTTTSNVNTDPDPPSITPVTAGAIVIATANAGHGNNSLTFTQPSGYGNFVTVTSSSSSFACYSGMASVAWTSGAEDPGVYDYDTAPFSWTSATIALRPLPEATSTPLSTLGLMGVG